MDVIITDSMIKQQQANPKKQALKTVDRIPAYDINYVMDDQKYHTYRVPAKTVGENHFPAEENDLR